MDKISVIQGDIAEDGRGHIRFVNEFDMSAVKRFYIIRNKDTKLIRGWRGHRKEQRWFYVLSGAFILNFVRIDNWITPNRELPVERIILKSSDMQLLQVPSGYSMAFRALEENSELLVYADYALKHAALDDYKWPQTYFYNSDL